MRAVLCVRPRANNDLTRGKVYLCNTNGAFWDDVGDPRSVINNIENGQVRLITVSDYINLLKDESKKTK